MAALRLSQAPAASPAPSPPAAAQPVPAVSAGEPPAKPVPAAAVPAAAVPALAALVGEPKGDGNATILGYNGFPMQMPD